MKDKILSITGIVIGTLAIVIHVVGYFKPHLTSNLGVADVNGLQDALNAKADANHQHEIGGVNGLQDALDSKANA